MFATADKSIQHLHFTISTTHKQKYRYVKSYVSTLVTSTHGFGSKTVALITKILEFSTLKMLVIMHEWVIILNNVKQISL